MRYTREPEQHHFPANMPVNAVMVDEGDEPVLLREVAYDIGLPYKTILAMIRRGDTTVELVYEYETPHIRLRDWEKLAEDAYAIFGGY